MKRENEFCACGYSMGEGCPECNGLRCQRCKKSMNAVTADAAIKPCSCDQLGRNLADLLKSGLA